MKFIVQRSVAGKGILERPLQFFVTRSVLGQPMPLQHPPRIPVHNKDRVFACLQQNRVRRLRPDSMNPQKLLA